MKLAIFLVVYVIFSALVISWYNHVAWDMEKDKLETRVEGWGLDNNIKIVYINRCRGNEKEGHCRIYLDSQYTVYRTVECNAESCFLQRTY